MDAHVLRQAHCYFPAVFFFTPVMMSGPMDRAKSEEARQGKGLLVDDSKLALSWLVRREMMVIRAGMVTCPGRRDPQRSWLPLDPRMPKASNIFEQSPYFCSTLHPGPMPRRGMGDGIHRRQMTYARQPPVAAWSPDRENSSSDAMMQGMGGLLMTESR